jgi:hypothetical protein
MHNSQSDQHSSSVKHEKADEFEYEEMELLEHLESLREDMEDLGVSTLAEVIQRIEELHGKLDKKHYTHMALLASSAICLYS